MPSLEEHINNPQYGRRYSEVLRLLDEQYQWDIEEVVSEEEEVLSTIAFALKGSMSPEQIAELVDNWLKSKGEVEEIETISTVEPPKAGYRTAGMFSGYPAGSEAGPPITPMRGPWTYPPTPGGSLDTPTITSPRSSKYHVPMWQTVRAHSLKHPEQSVKDMVRELYPISESTISYALAGREGKSTFARIHSDLERIVPGQSAAVKLRVASLRNLYGSGPDAESQEDKIKEEIVNEFEEKAADESSSYFNIINELAEKHKYSDTKIWKWVTEAGVYDSERARRERGASHSREHLTRKGTTAEELEEYVKSFGEEESDSSIARALGLESSRGTGRAVVGRVRKKLNMPKVRESRSDKIQYHILENIEHKSPVEIAKELKIGKPNIYYHMRELGISPGHSYDNPEKDSE